MTDADRIVPVAFIEIEIGEWKGQLFRLGPRDDLQEEAIAKQQNDKTDEKAESRLDELQFPEKNGAEKSDRMDFSEQDPEDTQLYLADAEEGILLPGGPMQHADQPQDRKVKYCGIDHQEDGIGIQPADQEFLQCRGGEGQRRDRLILFTIIGEYRTGKNATGNEHQDRIAPRLKAHIRRIRCHDK